MEHGPEKWEPVFPRDKHAQTRRSDHDPIHRIVIEQMEGVAGISRPRRRLFPGGGSKTRSL
jgi:hypothetical protein